MKQLTRMLISSVVFCFLLSSNEVAAKTLVKVIQGDKAQAEQISYFHALLAAALKQVPNKEYVLSPVSFKYSQNRTLKLLNVENALDVTYSMTSRAREQEFIAIKIPLLKGLMGKRRFLVLKENLARFETIDLTALRQLTACQSYSWPDYAILKRNKFSVYGTSGYINNYKMLAKKRCDYFPRGVVEIQQNLRKMKPQFPDLAIVENRMLVYPAYVYFFVGKNNKTLAQNIQFGLEQIRQSGEFDKIQSARLNALYDTSFEQRPEFKSFTLSIELI